ncbi:endonuclease III [Dictyobacter kobayashii]|uniref:Endonuclease III n=2 Tax=Dictyobacter kobayashii TaxID=2014872 RepID=A0A402AN43_9CHLR|nr:endonuclease III [Dictyobacter kobayashii]
MALSARALAVSQRLTENYGVSTWSKKDPMSMLVDIILSHRTKDEQTAAAYDSLLKKFGSWEAVRDAPTNEVQDAIANVNWPEVKAPRLQTIMRQITEERGNLDLNFLRELPVEEAAAWLNRFEGVGPKTTACVLLFSCQLPLLPVDVHVHRVSGRLGLIGKKVTADAAHNLLQALLPNDPRSIYNFHKALLRHGQRVCVYEHPRCGKCAITDLCDYYKTVVKA